MVKENNDCYICEACEMVFIDRKKACECEEFCNKNKACNLEIMKYSIQKGATQQ